MSNSPENPNIIERLAAVRAIISESCKKAGCLDTDIQLVAVSKRHPPEAVREAYEAGQLVFGESRVQEATAKVPQLPSSLHWHFIGHLQKNKIRHALPLFGRYHGIHSVDLAQTLDRHAGNAGLFPSGLLQINVSGEASKYGIRPNDLPAALEQIVDLCNLQIDGLMTMAPYSDDPEDARPHFAALRELRDAMQNKFSIGLPELSMGMSGDYTIAIEEGATLVRVGTAIFGNR